jgi:SPP1 gp7 family putative phage head morphogenesis protein
MGLLSSLRDRYLINPVAQRILGGLQTDTEKAQTPNAFAVPVGFNSAMASSNKRMTVNTVDFAMLRSLSVHHETTRAAINARKRQITQLHFDIVDTDDDADPQGTKTEREAVKQQLLKIGGEGVRFRELLDKLMEDVLVLDAMTFYKQRTRGGQLLRILPIDGATIKLRVDEHGLRPQAPETAFEQWIAGKKVADLSTQDLSYEMMNPRNNSPYGLSPIESLIISLDASMRALLYNLNYLSDNNVPQGFLQVPEGWNVQQIKEYKEWLDSIISGPKATAKIYPIPSGTTYQATSKPSDFAFGDFFNYLDLKICMLFDIQPQELGLNLKQYKENAEGQELIQQRKGVKPLANFLQEIFTDIVQLEFGFPQFKFKFIGIDGRYTLEDIKTLVPLGVLGIDEARNDRALSKIGINNLIMQGATIMPIEHVLDQPSPREQADQQAAQTEAQMKQDAQQAKIQSGTKKPATKLNKLGSNEGFEAIEKQAKFSVFQKNIKQGLKKQLLPFTKPHMIAVVTQTLKDDLSDTIEENVNSELESVNIFFDNKSIDNFLKWVAQQGGNMAYQNLNLNGSFKLTSEDFARILGDRSNYLIDSIDATSKDWLVNQIVQGKAASLTNDEIARQINDVMDTFTQARSQTIVNTEVANALGEAQVDIYKTQGFAEKEWVTSEDEKVCEICLPMDEQIVKVDDNFETGEGDSIDHEPAHPNCRCFTQAVLDTTE